MDIISKAVVNIVTGAAATKPAAPKQPTAPHRISPTTGNIILHQIVVPDGMLAPVALEVVQPAEVHAYRAQQPLWDATQADTLQYTDSPNQYRRLEEKVVSGELPIDALPTLYDLQRENRHRLGILQQRKTRIARTAADILISILERVITKVPAKLAASRKADAERGRVLGDNSPSAETVIWEGAEEFLTRRIAQLRGPVQSAPKSMAPYLFDNNQPNH